MGSRHKIKTKNYKTRAAGFTEETERAGSGLSGEGAMEQTTAVHKTSNMFLEFVQVILIKIN